MSTYIYKIDGYENLKKFYDHVHVFTLYSEYDTFTNKFMAYLGGYYGM